MPDEIKPPEIPKEIEDAAVDFVDKRTSSPLVPGFIKRAYIRKFIEGSWSKIWKEDNVMLMKVWNWLNGKKTYTGIALYALNHLLVLTGHWQPQGWLDKMAEGLATVGGVHKFDKILSAITDLKPTPPPQA